MKKNFLLLAVLIFSLSTGIAQEKTSTESSGIWFRNTNNFPNRFLYSQAILWPSSISGHIGLYLIKDDFDWTRAVRWSMYKRTFSQLPMFEIKEDHWSWNYGVHPYMGSITYLTYRNRSASVWESLAGSALNSVIYEYLIAGGTQPASLNDMIATPLVGSLLGEGLYQLKKFLLRDKYLTIFEKILVTICDPVEVFYFGFNYEKLARHSYR